MTRATEDTAARVTARTLHHIEKYLGAVDLEERARCAIANFDKLSRSYDKTNNAEKFFSPALLGKLAALHLPPKCGPILDLACGTGLLGQQLSAHGFDDLVGVDISERMLEKAKAKSVYHTLIQADLHHPLPFAPGMFSAIACSGAFYEEIMEVQVLARTLPLIRAGGHLICDVEMVAWETGGYREVLGNLESDGILRLVYCEPVHLFSADYPHPPTADIDLPHGVALVAQMVE